MTRTAHAGGEAGPNPSATLVEEVLQKVAESSRSSLQRIKRLEKGLQRRSMHDDILVTVVAMDFPSAATALPSPPPQSPHPPQPPARTTAGPSGHK
jgi:hypothetical protein